VNEKGHGRLESWCVHITNLESSKIKIPYARCALSIHHSGKRKGKPFKETRHYISNRAADAHSAEGWLQHVRNHWAGVENRLHWRKDACLREDATRSRKPNLVGALALLRNALFAVHQPHLESYGGLHSFTEAVAADVTFAYHLITRTL
jgi:predicted transposase YbfD/YdcC